MRCTDLQRKQGMTLVEMMISLTIFGLLSVAIWSNVQMHGRNFIYNRSSNANAGEASFVINRLVYGGSSTWGLRVASRSATSVRFTGVTGSQGQLGWEADVHHSVEVENQPTELVNTQQLITYNPLNETIDINGLVVGVRVTDSYFRIEGQNILFGVQVAEENRGRITLLETRVKMRNS